MKEGQWMGHDWQPTVSEPDKLFGISDVKDMFLELFHNKLKERVDAGEISQSKMDEMLVRATLHLPATDLFNSKDLKKYGADKVTVKKSDIELMAELLAKANEVDSSDNGLVAKISDAEIN